MLKKITFTILAILLASGLTAQHETLLGRSPLNGAFGAPIYEFAISDGLQGGIGGGGGLVFRNFFVGAYGVGATTGLEDLLNSPLNTLRLAHGGIWLGYTPGSYNVLHPYFSARGGWGVLDIDFDNPGPIFIDLDQVFVFTPEAGIELNIARWFRISGTVGYRLLAGVNEGTPADVTEDLEGIMGSVTLRFGWFGSNRNWRRHRWDD
ncbi:MAG: hypothetical protein AAFQ37_02880 [Bacteroidota bacterium]